MDATVPPSDPPPDVDALVQPLEVLLTRPDCVWVTDADGTLWRDDIGEGFLRELAADRALVSPEAQEVDVWEAYESRVAQDKAAGYAWAAQVMAGIPEEEVNRRADAFARRFIPPRLYPEMRALLEAARRAGCTPWIVSASPWWIVAAGAGVLGIPVDHAIGIRVAVQDHLLTSQVIPPITYRSGKVDAIREHIHATPTIVTGDSAGDVEMLKLASSAAVLIARPGVTDPGLLAEARRSRWLVHVASGALS